MLYGAQFNSALWRGGGTDSAAQQEENETNNMVSRYFFVITTITNICSNEPNGYSIYIYVYKLLESSTLFV